MTSVFSPFPQSPAQHTSQMSPCPTDVSSGLGCGACECIGIQRGAKFRPLTWLRTQGSQLAGPLEYHRTPLSPSYRHRSPSKILPLACILLAAG